MTKGENAFSPFVLRVLHASVSPYVGLRWIFYTSKFKERNLIAPVSRSSTKFVRADLILRILPARTRTELGWKEEVLCSSISHQQSITPFA